MNADPQIDEEFNDGDDDQWIDIEGDESFDGDVNEKIIANPKSNDNDDNQWIDIDKDDVFVPIYVRAIKAKRNIRIRTCKKKIKMLRLNLKQNQTKEVADMTDDDVIEFFSNKFNTTQMEFLKMQLQNPVEESKRTYSTAQKDFSLALQKEDPDKYSSLRSIFVLPYVKTLQCSKV